MDCGSHNDTSFDMERKNKSGRNLINDSMLSSGYVLLRYGVLRLYLWTCIQFSAISRAALWRRDFTA
jgi:hypothetical protein